MDDGRPETPACLGRPLGAAAAHGADLGRVPHRARARGGRIVLDPGARFLHPGSADEIFPIMGGRFCAVVPGDAFERRLQFRNRG